MEVAAMSDPVATVVLVHGAWHGAWCWAQVVDRLSARGVATVAVDLPGRGADPGLLTDLHGDAAHVRRVLDGLGAPVVLVGHSYGGAVITEAGDHAAVEHLVYLCAFALAENETCVSAAATEAAAAAISHAGRPDLSAGIIRTDPGMVSLEPSVAAACLYNACDPDTANWALDRLGPQPIVTLRQAPTTVAWRVKPSTYVVCANDQTIHPDLQRIMAQRCTGYTEWDSDHSPFLSQPDRLAALLIDLAVSRRQDRNPS
jgi:pimeloyl-ACP methyl ester carboxylesterase